MKGRTNRRGFTLGEILVSVAIVSVLAAVVIPAVTSQISKGDEGRVQSDLQSVRGGVQQFVADVREYPKSLGQLVVVPTTSQTPINSTTVYTTQELERWRGPYLNKDSVAAASTGYALRLGIGTGSPGPVQFDTMTVGTSGVVSNATAGNILYMVLTVPSMNQTTAQALDAVMDDGVLTTGSLRWKASTDGTNTTGAVDTLKYLLMPIIK